MGELWYGYDKQKYGVKLKLCLWIQINTLHT